MFSKIDKNPQIDLHCDWRSGQEEQETKYGYPVFYF